MGGRGQASQKSGHYNETEALKTLNTSPDHAARNTAAEMLAQNARKNESTTLQRQDMPIPEKMTSVPVQGVPTFFNNTATGTAAKITTLSESMDDMPDLWKPYVLSQTLTKQKSAQGDDIKASSNDAGGDITYWNDTNPTLDVVAPAVADTLIKSNEAKGKPLPTATYQAVFNGTEPSPSAPPPYTIEEDFQASLALYLQDKPAFQRDYPYRFAFIDTYVKNNL